MVDCNVNVAGPLLKNHGRVIVANPLLLGETLLKVMCRWRYRKKHIVTATKKSLHKVEYNFSIHPKFYKTLFLPEGNAEHFFHTLFLNINA